jgi:hypothetical protein
VLLLHRTRVQLDHLELVGRPPLVDRPVLLRLLDDHHVAVAFALPRVVQLDRLVVLPQPVLDASVEVVIFVVVVDDLVDLLVDALAPVGDLFLARLRIAAVDAVPVVVLVCVAVVLAPLIIPLIAPVLAHHVHIVVFVYVLR